MPDWVASKPDTHTTPMSQLSWCVRVVLCVLLPFQQANSPNKWLTAAGAELHHATHPAGHDGGRELDHPSYRCCCSNRRRRRRHCCCCCRVAISSCCCCQHRRGSTAAVAGAGAGACVCWLLAAPAWQLQVATAEGITGVQQPNNKQAATGVNSVETKYESQAVACKSNHMQRRYAAHSCVCPQTLLLTCACANSTRECCSNCSTNVCSCCHSA